MLLISTPFRDLGLRGNRLICLCFVNGLSAGMTKWGAMSTYQHPMEETATRGHQSQVSGGQRLRGRMDCTSCISLPQLGHSAGDSDVCGDESDVVVAMAAM